MKKTLLITGLATALGVATTSADAASLWVDGAYTMTITSGCFAYADCNIGGLNDLTDNTTANEANASSFGLPAGSGITSDGKLGIIDFTLSGGNMTVTSFSQDSYSDSITVVGTFYIRSTNLATMGGSIDAAGNMNFDPTGRVALGANIGSSELAWNIDDATNAEGGVAAGTGLATMWTTGTSTARLRTGTSGSPLTKTGSVLTDNGVGGWDGQLVSVGNYGSAWGSAYDGINYTELFNVTITAAAPQVPVPAAVWLFGSGLLGLIGVARRRKQA